ncbi:MAG: type II secretion system protein [Gemmataceae bacterium]
MKMTTRHSRRGITLIELLIVIAIVSMLTALTAGAVFRVRESQEKGFTETTLRKLATVLDQHWKAVGDGAKKEYDSLPADVKQNLITLADNSTTAPKPHPRRDDRARLLYVKFRLKQEFPISFAQVLTQGTTTETTARTVLGPDRIAGASTPTYLRVTSATVTNPSTSAKANVNTTAKPSYLTAVFGSTVNPANESSILLAMALQQSRSGLPTISLEQLVGSRYLANENGFTYLIDAWGNPLQFYIFPAYDLGTGTSTSDLDIERTTTPFDISKERQDSQDPERLLLHPSYSKWTPPTINGQHPFETLLHRQIQPPVSPALGQAVNRRMVPIIVSYGLDSDLGGLTPAAGNTEMVLTGSGALDNIYSHRLRQTAARGD